MNAFLLQSKRKVRNASVEINGNVMNQSETSNVIRDGLIRHHEDMAGFVITHT